MKTRRILDTDWKFPFEKIAITIWILLAENLCYFIQIDKSFRFYALLILPCILIIFYVALEKHIDTSTLGYIIGILVFLICQFVFTSNSYSRQTFKTFFSDSASYFYIFFAYPLYRYVARRNSIDEILDIILIVVMGAYIAIAVTAIMRNHGRTPIFNVSYYTGGFSSRAGRVRIGNGKGLYGLAYIWAWYRALYRDKDFRYLLCGIFILWETFWVDQTRGIEAALMATLLTMIILRPMKTKNERWVKGAVIVAGVIVFFLSGIYDKIMDSISVTGVLGSSTQVRMDEVTYAAELFIENPLTGHGLMKNDVRDHYLNYNGMGHFGYTDIGIIGQLAKIGLPCCLLIYIIPMIRFTKTTLHCYRNRTKNYPVLAGLLVYLLATTPTLIVLNYERFLLWPFCVVLYTVYEKKERDLQKQMP